jgi:hypothetical protein
VTAAATTRATAAAESEDVHDGEEIRAFTRTHARTHARGRIIQPTMTARTKKREASLVVGRAPSPPRSRSPKKKSSSIVTLLFFLVVCSVGVSNSR